MNLHRSNGQPDWADTPPERYNSWQRLASATDSILTPGNLITVFGLILVIIGLIALWRHHYVWGLISLAIGRGFDLLDGLAAEATKTKSPLGETFDATADKIGTFLTLLTLAAGGFAPIVLLAAVAIPHIVISILAYRAERSGRRLHPSPLGKLSMAAAWVGLLMLMIPNLTNNQRSGPIYITGLVIAFASIIMGSAATAAYLRASRNV